MLLTSALHFSNIAQASVFFKAATWRGATPLRFFVLTSRGTKLFLITISTMRPCILSAALCKKVFPCLSIGLLKSMLLLHNMFSTKLRSFLAKASRRSKTKKMSHKNPLQSGSFNIHLENLHIHLCLCKNNTLKVSHS